MNVVVVATDAKGLSSLNSLIKELAINGHGVFAMVTQSTTLRNPILHKQDFHIISNVPKVNKWFSNTLKEQLPFTPDWLIVNRERWNPESNIISEFRKKGSRVALVEPNSWILNGAESRLETLSRNRFTDLIDKFFIGSEHGKKQQHLAGFVGNLVVTGNPKYDINFTVEPNHITFLKEYYKIDQYKNNYLLFSLVNSHRNTLNKIFKNYDVDNDIATFYKPYPGEPYEFKFKKDFKPSFFLSNTKPILEENHVWGMFDLCDTHVGIISSIVHATLLKRKKYIDHSLDLGLPEKYLDFSGIFRNNGPGLENNKAMWMRTFNFTNDSQLRELLPNSYRSSIETANNKVWSNLDNSKELLNLYDNFNDGNAAKRIINELQK